MARLHRFVKLHDRLDTQVFTFLLPPTLVNEAPKDIESKEFPYGNQKWSVFIVKNDQHIGVYLCLKGATEGLRCTVDFSFTFNNKEHFTKNDTFSERACAFTHGRPQFGRKHFVTMTDLVSRNYAMDNGQFILSLELRSVTNTFEQDIQLPSENSKSNQIGGANRYQKHETTYFPCGNFVWNLAVFPFGDIPEKDGIPMIYLVRQTNFDHHCRVRYKLIIGQGDKVMESDVIEQTFDTSGSGKPYEIRSNFRYSLYALASGKKLTLRVEFYSATAISECNLFPKNREKNKAISYDREKQGWLIESDMSLTYLRFRLFYTDVRNISSRHIRYVGFSLSVVPRRGHYKPIKAIGVPYFQLYPQADCDVEGYDIHTEISVKEINNPASAILDEEGRLTLHLEWIDSLMLFNDTYNKIDEIESRHKHQMAREIMALQTENLSLEKQLHSYQVAIAKTNAKDGTELPLNAALPPAAAAATAAHKGSPQKDPLRRAVSPRNVQDAEPRKATSGKKERYKAHRRLPVPDVAIAVVPVDDRNNGHYSNGPTSVKSNQAYGYSDAYQDPAGRWDGYNTGGQVGYALDDPTAGGYTDSYGQGDYYDGRTDYQYYSDKYSKADYNNTGLAGNDRYYDTDPYNSKPDVNNKKIDPYNHKSDPYNSKEDPYGTSKVDDYASPAHSVKSQHGRYSEAYSSKYNEAYGSPAHSAGDTRYNPAMDMYPEDLPFPKDRYGRKSSDGSRTGKLRDQQSDDGYYSSTQRHVTPGSDPSAFSAVQPANMAALSTAASAHAPILPQGLGAQYLEKYPDDRSTLSNGRRSPRHKSGSRRSSTGSDGVGKGSELGSQSPSMSRSKSRRDRHRDK